MDIIFVICIIICITALVFAFKAQQKNYGYVMTTVLLIICDIISYNLINSETLKNSRNLLFIYYLAYSWMFFGTLWTIVKMAASRKNRITLLGMGSISALLSFMVYYCFTTPRIITFSKRILFGRIWWTAEAVARTETVLNFRAYTFLCVLSCLFIIVVTWLCLLGTHKMLRSKFVMIILLQVFLMIMVIADHVFNLPVWIDSLIMNVICYVTFYYVYIHTDLRLRNEVIMSFANEMSDGLILYNAYNDLIHVNDLIGNLLDPEFLIRIKDIKVLEEWISHVEYVENIKTLPYKKGDEEIYFTVRKQFLGTEENPVGTVYMFHDTTFSINQIRLMEKVNSELERTSRMKSDFLANMSHELRTPMNAVIGMAQIALRENPSPKLRDCLNQISDSGTNLLGIINDILDYSKIDAGRMDIISERYEPLYEFNDIVSILQTKIGDKPIKLHYSVDPDLPQTLLGDSMRIRQILMNMANNAIKFTDNGSVGVTLTCERVADEDILLTYHIIDTGRGIKEEDMDKLFVSFSQIDSSRNGKVEGTGLGLAISKSLCEAMGGSVGVSSRFGEGSDFWFTIPQKVIPDEAGISSVKTGLGHDGQARFIAPDACILIVDDNDINLSIAKGLIEPLKIQCETAESGAEAIEKLMTAKYDLIFMDHMMPEMDGIETTQAIRERIPAAADTPIIAVTANVADGNKDMYLQAGMVDMIPKPIDVKVLNQKLYAWLPEYKIQHMDAEDIENLEKDIIPDEKIFDCLECKTAIEALGSASLFRKITEEYYKRGENTLKEIENAYLSSDMDTYAIKTHALKSSSRQIGAMELGDLAEKLEHAGKANDTETVKRFHNTAMDVFRKLLSDLSAYFPEGESQDLPLITDEEIRVIFAELELACDDLEIDDMEACAQKLKSHSYLEDKKEIIDSLCDMIDKVDTENCIDLIHRYFK